MYIAIDFVVAIVAYLQFPETRRMSIEEISLVFDYGTKEGRERALEELHHNGDSKINGDGADEHIGDEETAGKQQPTHIDLPEENQGARR